MSKSRKFTINDLSPEIREKLAREDSRRLGKGNGPTVPQPAPAVAKPATVASEPTHYLACRLCWPPRMMPASYKPHSQTCQMFATRDEAMAFVRESIAQERARLNEIETALNQAP